MIKEESLSLEDKQKIAQNLVERYLRENGYQGEIPEVLLTDEAHSFSVDSKDKETGAKRKEKIYFSKNDIADPNLAFSKLFGHEKAHMNTYDEGKYGEDTSIHTTKKIGSENKNKVFTEEEKADYLNNLRNKYKDQKSIEQQFAEAKLVPEKDKEHFIYEIAIEVLEKNPYIVEDTLALIDSTLLLNLSEEEVRARAEKNKKELDKLFGNNDKDEIDNLNDIKNYKSIIISGNKNIKGEEEDKEEQVTNVESASASSPSPLPDPNNKDDKDKNKKENEVNGLERTGSATKKDAYHAFNDIIDNYAGDAHKFEINNGELYQIEGSLNGVDGRFEWIIQDGRVTHRMFVEGGVITGKPIDPIPSISTDFYLNLKP